MPCIAVPKPPAPTLPAPFSTAPPGLPSVGADLTLCCKTLPLKTPPLNPPFGPLVANPAVIVALRQGIQTILTYIDQLAIDCPREL